MATALVPSPEGVKATPDRLCHGGTRSDAAEIVGLATLKALEVAVAELAAAPTLATWPAILDAAIVELEAARELVGGLVPAAAARSAR